MNPRLAVALLAGRTASLVSKHTGRGGTVLPGHVIPWIDPGALRHLSGELRYGSVVLSGTNGKTTTTRMVAHIVAEAGFHPLHNRSGANLMTGVVSAIASHSSLTGRPAGNLAVLEVDEATVPSVTASVFPRVLALTNVFRDQLDRYGEVDLIASAWRVAVSRLEPSATLILNADDPTVAQLARDAPCPVLTFGFEGGEREAADIAHDADRRLCPFCSARLTYTWTAYSHIGHFSCNRCGWSRPRPDITASDWAPNGLTSSMTVRSGAEQATIQLPLPGLYNAYNALGAVAVARGLGIDLDLIAGAIGSSEAVFGRFERIAVGDGAIVMALVKNPVGFNQVLQTLVPRRPAASPTPEQEAATVIIAINDLFADGTDISWLWDVDFELLADTPHRLVCAGTRANDMAVRLKYAEAGPATMVPTLTEAVDCAEEAARSGETVLVFPTYTAMLAMRRELQKRGHVSPFWED